MKANATVLNFYREDCGKMDDLQKLNNKLVKSCKKANRDFFILAAALCCYTDVDDFTYLSDGREWIQMFSITGIRKCIFYVRYYHADCGRSYRDISDCYCGVCYRVGRCEWHRRR